MRRGDREMAAHLIHGAKQSRHFKDTGIEQLHSVLRFDTLNRQSIFSAYTLNCNVLDQDDSECKNPIRNVALRSILYSSARVRVLLAKFLHTLSPTFIAPTVSRITRK